jgi:hypothetical protein
MDVEGEQLVQAYLAHHTPGGPHQPGAEVRQEVLQRGGVGEEVEMAVDPCEKQLLRLVVFLVGDLIVVPQLALLSLDDDERRVSLSEYAAVMIPSIDDPLASFFVGYRDSGREPRVEAEGGEDFVRLEGS